MKQAAALLVLSFLLSYCAFPQETSAPEPDHALELLNQLLNGKTSDEQWQKAEKEFEALTPRIALPVLFPEVAKGVPGAYSYATYNCSDPLHDRKVPFCIVSWLWCKQLACVHRRDEVSKVLLELWAHPVSYYGQRVLLEGLCSNQEAESRIATLFRDASADVRLRTQAAACLLLQNGPRYHYEVVAFAQQVPIRFQQTGWDVSLRRWLFDELASARHRGESGIDPAVVRMGFTLLLDEAEQQRKASQPGGNVSYYAQFIYADHLNTYLRTAFEPDRKQPIYSGNEGNERFWQDTVANALDWWSKHEGEYTCPHSSACAAYDPPGTP